MNKLDELISIVEEQFKLTPEKSNEVIDNIRERVRSYIEKSNIKSLVVGVSGGLDSAVVAALCQEKYTGVPLVGLHIPLSTTDEHSEQADWVGKEYCSKYGSSKYLEEERLEGVPNYVFTTLNIMNENQEIAETTAEQWDAINSIRQGNIKARLRMITLYDMARLTNGLVLSTDNYSEYLAGFWTIAGDVGDYGPIQYIYKGLELPYVAKELGIREDIITQPPSDGLGVTEENTDEAQLGCDYKTFDTIMTTFIRHTKARRDDRITKLMDEIKDNPLIDKVSNRVLATEFKRTGSVSLSRPQIGLV